MRVFLNTLVHWIIAAGLIVGAIAYFSIPANTNWSLLQIESVLAAIVIGAMISACTLALPEAIRSIFLQICTICLGVGICVYIHFQGRVDIGWETLSALASLFLIMALWFMALDLVGSTHRFLTLVCCWFNPDEIQKYLANLDSPNPRKKSFAVQTMADYLGQAMIRTDNWPFASKPDDELEFHAAKLKRLWEAKQAALAECPSEGWLLHQLGKSINKDFFRLTRQEPDEISDPESFEASRSSKMADTPSKSLPSLEPSRLIEAMQSRIAEVLQEIAQIINEARAGSLVVECEEPVGELLAQLFLEAYQSALTLRMESPEIEFPGTPSGASVWKLSDGGFLTVVHLMERAGDFFKNTLLDLNLLPEEVQVEPDSDDPPKMSTDEFLVLMLPQVEIVLKRFVDITNQSTTGLILVAEEPRLCRLFAKLHAQTLETGLELRVRQTERLGLIGYSKTSRLDSSFMAKGERFKVKESTSPSLRRAASPPLPPSVLGWAQKYRHMRIAGTRFPLLQKDSDQI